MSTDQQRARFLADFDAVKAEIGKVIVGQEDVITGTLTALIAGGHVLLEGLPGLGKTLLARTLGGVLDLSFQRIQCTPDLMPADVIGTYVVMESSDGRRTFEFHRGPLFANVVLADHINRTTPKTQSAMLEAMQEEEVTLSTETFSLPAPFLLIATQNPLEMEGAYPLPEAQIDRFFFKLSVRPPSPRQLEEILQRTTEGDAPYTKPVVDGPRITEMGNLVRGVKIPAEVRRWGISLVTATHPDSQQAPESVRRYVRFGSSPRGDQALVLGAKVRAVLEGRPEVSCEDLRAVAHAALRHRLILNFEGHSEDVRPDEVIDNILETTREPTSG